MEELLASGDCGIDDEGIKNINLAELSANNNPKITNVNHMTKLKILYASRNCGIGDYGIKDVNLEKLHRNNNLKISNIIWQIWKFRCKFI